jgi:zinc protease
VPFRRRSVSILILFMALLFPVSGPAQAASLAERVVERELPNGLKVLLLENPKVPEITFQVWYRVGSRNETWGKTGLSHMLEHMMFKGTRRVSGEQFFRTIEENGGQENAFTSSDFTAYFENLSSDRLLVPIDLESDRMVNLMLREEDFRTEKMVVLEERRMRTEDNPQAYLSEQLEAAAFQVSPYHWPVIGWQEDITGLTLEDLQAYYRTYYSPANAVLVVVGDFRTEELWPRIEKAFGPLPRQEAPAQKKGLDPPQSGERRIVVSRPAELPFLLMGYHVPNLQNPDAYVLEVIEAVLAGGKSSRLYQGLVREKQLALSVDADNALLSRDPQLFTLSAQPLPGRTARDLEKALDQELDRLQKEPVPEVELEKAKNQLEAAFIYGQDSLFAQAMLLGHYEIASSWKAADDYLPAIRKVTAADIQRVAGQYLLPRNRTVGILEPQPPREGQALKPAPPGSGRMIR